MLKDLLLQNRSYRSFAPGVAVPRDVLMECVDCARLCPSSINLQMVKFRLVEGEECEKVFPLTRWAGKIKDMRLPPAGHEPTAYIVLCTDTDAAPENAMFLKDVGICAQTVMLSATEQGFGGCMIGSCDQKELKKVLKLTENLTPQLVLALGKPDEEIVLTPAAPDGSVTYYRENGIHHVQKRSVEDLIV